MKTKLTLKRIMTLGLGLVLVMMVAVSISCKKKADDTPTPTPTPTPKPTPPATPNVFSYRPLHIKNAYEKSNNISFPVHLTRLIGKGLVGGEDPEVPNPFKKIGKNLWDVHDYLHTEHEFKTIDQGLNELQGQIAQLSAQLTAMGKYLSYEISNLQTYFTTANLTTQIGLIQDAWSSGGPPNNFMFFSDAASNWESDSTNPTYIAQMQYAQQNTLQFALNCNNTGQTLYMPPVINAIKNLIVPPLGTVSDNALMGYVSTLVQGMPGKITDTAQAMAAYAMLESYFLTVYNYQTQAVTVYINALNVIDSTGAIGLAANYWNQTFVGEITQEVQGFLQAVDFMITNLSDYRTSDRFQSDMYYANTGLAPDQIWLHVAARSQFVANLITSGLGYSYPVMCGYVLTPWNYTNGNSPIINQLTLNFTNNGSTFTRTANANKYQSQIPYTYWVSGGTANCGADNNWNVYRIGQLDTADGGWVSNQNIPVIIPDNGNMYSPWTHYAPIQGNVKTMFYNPQDPEAPPTGSWTSTNSVQFGYFSVNWQWGYLYMSNLQQSNWQHTDNFTVDLYNFVGYPGKTVPAPQTCTTDDKDNLYPHGTADLTFSYPGSTSGLMQASGSVISTGYYYIAYDCINYNMSASSDPAGLTNSDLQAWCSYNAYYDMGGTADNDLWFTIGTDLYHYNGSTGWSSNGSLIDSQHLHNISGNWSPGFVYKTGISRNTNFSPSFQWVFQTYNAGLPSLNVMFINNYQLVYTGNFPVPQNK
ncbi:MAG: hypothetical protein WCO02_08610 [Bacteroidota bacterium]